MERAFERAFERKLHRSGGKADSSDTQRCSSRDDGTVVRKESAAVESDDSPMTAEDAIPRILSYANKRNFFSCLQLPQPSCDEINRPVWSCTHSDISKGYRTISRFVHPDKNPHPMAREAFEALNLAVRTLRDPNQLEVLMKEAAEVAREERERRSGGGDVHTRIAERANFKEREKELQKEERMDFDAKIKAQMRERQERLKRKKRMQSSSRYSRRGEDDTEDGFGQGAGADDSDDGAAERREAKIAKAKRKPKMIF